MDEMQPEQHWNDDLVGSLSSRSSEWHAGTKGWLPHLLVSLRPVQVALRDVRALKAHLPDLACRQRLVVFVEHSNLRSTARNAMRLSQVPTTSGHMRGMLKCVVGSHLHKLQYLDGIWLLSVTTEAKVEPSCVCKGCLRRA